MVNRDLLEAHRKTLATPKGVFSADNETLSNLHSVSKKSIKEVKAVSIERRAESMHLSKRTKTAKLKSNLKTFDTVKRPQTKGLNSKTSKQYLTDADPLVTLGGDPATGNEGSLRALRQASKTPKIAIKKFGQKTLSNTFTSKLDRADFGASRPRSKMRSGSRVSRKDTSHGRENKRSAERRTPYSGAGLINLEFGNASREKFGSANRLSPQTRNERHLIKEKERDPSMDYKKVHVDPSLFKI